MLISLTGYKSQEPFAEFSASSLKTPELKNNGDKIKLNRANTPILSSIIPSSGRPGQTLDITITGVNTNFSQSSETILSFSFEQGSSSIVNSYNITDDLNLIANITIPASTASGDYNVYLYNNIDGTLELQNAFTIIDEIIWIDDFSDPSTWVLNNQSQSNPNGWSIDSSVDGWFFNSSVNSSSGGNFAELTNGTYNDVTNGTCPVLDSAYTMTTANAIDILSLAGTNRVLLSWEEYGARFNDLQQVFVSTDSGNTWFEVANHFNYDVLSANGGSAYPNPTTREVNIGSYIAENPSNVLLRFSWTTNFPNSSNNGAWITYGWMIDDVKISILPENEIINQLSYIYNDNNYGAEYGRTPLSQTPNQWRIGSQVLNNGNQSQHNLTLNADFINEDNPDTISIEFSISDTLLPDSTIYLDAMESLSFETGIYDGVLSITSVGDTINGEYFDNNIQKRNFEITNNVYSLDGIGIHPNELESLTSIGPNNFEASQDLGILLCATMYKFISPDTINSVRAYISSTTTANSEITLYIIDSLSFMNGEFENAISTSDLYIVNNQDIVNGYVNIPVIGSPWQNPVIWGEGLGTSSVSVDPGSYYAVLEINSLAGEYDIGIIDDLTVGQPGWSSAIWLPGEGVYTNGNAFAIRLNLGFNESTVGIKEKSNRFNIFPNPSNGNINIVFDDIYEKNVIIRDMNGKLVLKTKLINSNLLSLSNLNKGSYFAEINFNGKSVVERFIIK